MNNKCLLTWIKLCVVVDGCMDNLVSSSALVARSSVSLSVRRRSTAAALAQTATPETQENR